MNGGKRPKDGPKTLYNHPISSVVDYIVVNLVAILNRVGSESGGRLKYKSKSKIEENEEAIRQEKDFEPVTTEWMFSTLRAKHYEPAGQPITRITKQLRYLNSIIWKELGLGVGTPDGFWDWLGGKKGERTEKFG